MSARKAQFSTEFIVTWSLVLLLFSALFSVYLDKAKDFSDLSARKSAEAVAADFARNANFVHLSGKGSFARVWLRPNLERGENYTLRILGKRVEINWSSQLVSESLLFSSFNGSSGIVIVQTGAWANLSNVGGVISLAQD